MIVCCKQEFQSNAGNKYFICWSHKPCHFGWRVQVSVFPSHWWPFIQSLSSSLDLARSREYFKLLVYWQGAEGCWNNWNELCFLDQLLRRPDDIKVTLWRQRNLLWIHIRSQYCLYKCRFWTKFFLYSNNESIATLIQNQMSFVCICFLFVLPTLLTLFSPKIMTLYSNYHALGVLLREKKTNKQNCVLHFKMGLLMSVSSLQIYQDLILKYLVFLKIQK